MKLLQRTGQYYLIFSTLIFIISGLGLYFALGYVIRLESDEQLIDAREVLNEQLSMMDTVPAYISLLDNLIEITPVDTFSPILYFKDTLFWNGIEEEHQSSYRKLVYYDTIRGMPYQIELNRNNLDTEEMLTTIVFWIIGILALLLLTINLFNRFLSLKIWQPFYRSISQIKTFTFKQNATPAPVVLSDIEEFDTLQQAIHRMTSKIIRDYQSLKRFTENASHEIQTPLAIIRSKIELLIQEEGLREPELHAILHIQQATNRISKLNQSLLLLTRIENKQYINTKKINLKTFIQNILDQVEPMYVSKGLVITVALEEVYLLMDPILAEVLIQNLLGNAIKHNLKNGYIDVVLTQEKLQIRNTGAPLNLDTQLLFERFRKGVDNSMSLGLGLAIAREICLNYGFDIQYKNESNQHCMSVLF